MIDVAAGFGIDQRNAGLAIEMAGEIGEFVGQDFEDRGVDLNAVDAPGAEIQPGKNIPTAAYANDGDVSWRLHQVGGIDHVVLQVRQLADIAVVPGNDRACISVDIEEVLIDCHLRRVGEAPTERSGLSKRGYPDTRVSIPALEQRSDLLIPF